MANPRLLDARFTFQADVGQDDHIQFCIRLYRKDDDVKVCFDVHGSHPLEGVDPAFLDAVTSAIEKVKDRVRVEELEEQ